MASMNMVMILGRLGKDPDLKYTNSGMAICNMTIATDESWTDKEGVKQERTEWHRVVVYQRQAENCTNYLHKGSMVLVEGSLQTRKWQDQNGQDKYTTEIKAQRVQFLDSKPKDGNGGQNGAPAQMQQHAPQHRPTPSYDNNQPDQCPF